MYIMCVWYHSDLLVSSALTITNAKFRMVDALNIFCLTLFTFRLECLILNDCELEKIEFPDTHYCEQTSLFPRLKNLQFKSNRLSEV